MPEFIYMRVGVQLKPHDINYLTYNMVRGSSEEKRKNPHDPKWSCLKFRTPTTTTKTPTYSGTCSV